MDRAQINGYASMKSEKGFGLMVHATTQYGVRSRSVRHGPRSVEAWTLPLAWRGGSCGARGRGRGEARRGAGMSRGHGQGGRGQGQGPGVQGRGATAKSGQAGRRVLETQCGTCSELPVCRCRCRCRC